MQPDEPDSIPELAPRVAPSTRSGSPSSAPVPRPRLLAAAVAGGLLAGAIAWFGGEAAYGRFQPTITYTPEYESMSIYEKDNFRSSEVNRTRPLAEAKNSALAFGLLGALLGGTLGLGAGLARGAPRAGLLGAAGGVVAGAAVGAAVAWVAVPQFFEHHEPELGGLVVPTTIHAVILGALGAAAGVGLGLGLGGRGAIAPAVVGGIAGGLVGAVVYEVALAVAFPLMLQTEPVPPEKAARFLMHLSGALFIALGAALSVTGQKERPRRGPQAA